MRRIIAALSLIGVVVGTSMLAPASTDAAGCNVTAPVSTPADVSDLSPDCSFVLTCDDGTDCTFAVQLSVNGGGLVSGSMTAELAGGVAAVFWSGGPSTPNTPPPSCEGLLSCSAGTTPEGFLRDAGPVLRIVPRAGIAWVVVHCIGGGLAVLETVTCSAALA